MPARPSSQRERAFQLQHAPAWLDHPGGWRAGFSTDNRQLIRGTHDTEEITRITSAGMGASGANRHTAYRCGRRVRFSISSAILSRCSSIMATGKCDQGLLCSDRIIRGACRRNGRRGQDSHLGAWPILSRARHTHRTQPAAALVDEHPGNRTHSWRSRLKNRCGPLI